MSRNIGCHKKVCLSLTMDCFSNEILIQVVERESLLEELKIYGRDVNNSDPIYTKNVSIE
jgi:hypothetical protein